MVVVSVSQSRSMAGVEQAVVGHAGPEDGVGVAGLFAALLPEPGDQRFDGGGLLSDGEQGAGARQDLAPGRGHGGDALGGGGGGQRGLHPVAAQHVDRLGVTDDGDIDDPLEQGGLGAEAHVHGARADPGAPGYGVQRGGHVPVGEEQLGRRGDDPLLGVRDLGLAQRRQCGLRG